MEIYQELLGLIERSHRRFLETVKLELEGAPDLDDLNNIQALILFNIGDADLTVGELTQRGCYQGVNVSYNLQKLVKGGYALQTRSKFDQRVFYVRLTQKGQRVRQRLLAMCARHIAQFRQAEITEEDLNVAAAALLRLESLWRLAQPPSRPGG